MNWMSLPSSFTLNSIIMHNWLFYLILLSGILFVVHFAYLFFISEESRKWTSTKGLITNSETVISRSGWSGNYGTLRTGYKPEVKYQYEVDMYRFSGERIYFGNFLMTNSSKSSRQITDKYIRGQEVIVYYDSSKPSRSVLQTGVHSPIYRELLAGIICIGLYLLSAFGVI